MNVPRVVYLNEESLTYLVVSGNSVWRVKLNSNETLEERVSCFTFLDAYDIARTTYYIRKDDKGYIFPHNVT